METGGMKTALSAAALALSLALAGCGGSSGGMDNTRIEMQNIDGLVSTASAAVAKLKGDGVTETNVQAAERAVQAANRAVAANEHLSDADEQRYEDAIATLDQTVDLASDRLAAEKKADQAETAKQQAETAQKQAETAKQQADAAKQKAEAEKARAEAARRQAEEDEREAQRQLAQKQAAEDLKDAKALFAGVGGWESSSNGIMVEATQGGPATIELTRGNLNEMPKSTVSRLSGSNGWSGTRVSAPGDKEGFSDTVVVYTNIGAPTKALLTERYPNLNSAGTLTDNAEDYSQLVVGSGFSRDNDPVDLAEGKDPSTDPLKVSGSFAGVLGDYKCSAPPCTSQIGPGNKGVKLGSNWTFEPRDDEAMVSVQATDHSYFGWWLKKTDTNEDTDTFAVQVFHRGAGNQVGGVTPSGDLTGTADYAGPAVGQYAMLQDGRGTTHVGGSFTATARLKADFDETDNKVTGKITGFRGDPSNSSMSSWEVRLDSSDTAAIWYVGDNKRTADGASSFTPVFRNAPNASGTPMALTGTWQTSHQLDLDGTPQTTGHMIGAFGATKQ